MNGGGWRWRVRGERERVETKGEKGRRDRGGADAHLAPQRKLGKHRYCLASICVPMISNGGVGPSD